MESQYLTVTGLTKYLKRKFDVDPYLRSVYLVGEISNFRLRSKHQYFSLKDDHAKINAIMFESAFQKIKFMPEEGMKVLVRGHISLYEKTGNYQIYVEEMQPDGVGALYQAFEQLKKKLAAEGLFDLPKKPINRFPKRIAVVTSPSGAVIHDIITTVQRRFPIAQVVLLPTVVQGSDAAADIVRQIKRANEAQNFDTLIIGRGGGSIEDLWPFNEESVARAISASNIPVISSVGHETDTTIADLVADVRAPTPTAAAELATLVLNDVQIKLRELTNRLNVALNGTLNLTQQRLNQVKKSYIFQQPQRLYEGYLQSVGEVTQRLITAYSQQLNQSKYQYKLLQQRLDQTQLTTKLATYEAQLKGLERRLFTVIRNLISQHQVSVQNLAGDLNQLSPLNTMARGYSYTTRGGTVINSVKELQIGTSLDVHFTNGIATTTVTKITTEDGEDNG